MAKCSLCGRKIEPYFDLCPECKDNKFLENSFTGQISMREFMKNVGIINYEG